MPNFDSGLLLDAISVIVVAVLGFITKRTSDKAADLIKAQQELREAEARMKEMEKKEILASLQSIDDAVAAKFDSMDDKLKKLLSLSNNNFEFSQNLSHSIYSIGEALNNSDIIHGDVLSNELENIKKNETRIVSEIYKIIY